MVRNILRSCRRKSFGLFWIV